MFPIEMKHIGKIEAVGTVQVFGYSARRIDRNLCDLAYLNFAGPPSLHPSGRPYRALGPLDVLHMPAVGVSSSLISAIADHFRALSYCQLGDWFNGPCIHPEWHARGDCWASFGFNCQTGMGGASLASVACL